MEEPKEMFPYAKNWTLPDEAADTNNLISSVNPHVGIVLIHTNTHLILYDAIQQLVLDKVYILSWPNSCTKYLPCFLLFLPSLLPSFLPFSPPPSLLSSLPVPSPVQDLNAGLLFIFLCTF
jgi:hypothetical protein